MSDSVNDLARAQLVLRDGPDAAADAGLAVAAGKINLSVVLGGIVKKTLVGWLSHDALPRKFYFDKEKYTRLPEGRNEIFGEDARLPLARIRPR